MKKFNVNQRLVDKILAYHIVNSKDEKHFKAIQENVYRFLHTKDYITEGQYSALLNLGKRILKEEQDPSKYIEFGNTGAINKAIADAERQKQIRASQGAFAAVGAQNRQRKIDDSVKAFGERGKYNQTLPGQAYTVGRKAGQKVGRTLRKASDSVNNFADKGLEKTGQIADKVYSKGEDVIRATPGAIQQAPDKAVEGLGKAGDAIYRTADRARLAAAPLVTQIAGRARDSFNFAAQNPAGWYAANPALVGGAALVGVAGAAYLVNKALKRNAWRKKGCDGLEGAEKNKCLAYVNVKAAKELNSELKKCQDEKCRAAVQKKIQQLGQTA